MLLFIPGYERVAPAEKRSFNTSHVVIYPGTVSACREITSTFQYISCCYLSTDTSPYFYMKFQFQYISCCYLSILCYSRANSIYTFQYISCCYLSYCLAGFDKFYLVSIHLMLLFIRQRRTQRQQSTQTFQYISCCYLSRVAQIIISRSKKFQYISCCYLSREQTE